MDKRLSSIGNYKLSRDTIGRGSFSRVVLANHIVLNKNVALKVISLDKIKDPYVRKNLFREAKLMEVLSHPNVVPLHEVCFADTFYCLSMDLYEGGCLCNFVMNSPDSKLSESTTKVFFKQIV